MLPPIEAVVRVLVVTAQSISPCFPFSFDYHDGYASIVCSGPPMVDGRYGRRLVALVSTKASPSVGKVG